MNGLAFYDLLRSTQGHRETRVVFLSAGAPLDVVKEIGHRGVVLLEKKSFELDDLLNVIQCAFAES